MVFRFIFIFSRIPNYLYLLFGDFVSCVGKQNRLFLEETELRAPLHPHWIRMQSQSLRLMEGSDKWLLVRVASNPLCNGAFSAVLHQINYLANTHINTLNCISCNCGASAAALLVFSPMTQFRALMGDASILLGRLLSPAGQLLCWPSQLTRLTITGVDMC